MVVVSSVGRGASARWLLGSVAERTAQTSPVPVLVVRDATPFVNWAARKQPLRIMLAADFSANADAAIEWVGGLRTIEPCDVVIVYSSWPPAERRRLGTSVRATLFENDPEIHAILQRDLERKAGALEGDGDVRVRVESSLGRAATHVVDMAVEEAVDLLVVGTHQRHGASRLWHGSVSRAVLHAAPMSVARVPRTRPIGHEPPQIPELRSVLAATDFSDLGDLAVPFAYALLPNGGTVHVMHVVGMSLVQDLAYCHYETGVPPTDEQRAAQEPELAAHLQALIPKGAAARGIETHLHIVEAGSAAAAISMAAERLATRAC
jgi:nucleotide-binding universal stress UspA family protein